MNAIEIIYEKTDEIRPPKRGEYFIDADGRVTRALDDYLFQKFHILRAVGVGNIAVEDQERSTLSLLAELRLGIITLIELVNAGRKDGA